MNFEGGTVTRGDVDSFGYYTVYNEGTFNMSGGLITNGSCASSMVCNVAGGSKFVMTGGELKQEGFSTLKNEDGSTVEISGGTLTSGDRTLQNYGTATISGGTFNGDIQIPGKGNIVIKDGTIKGEVYGTGTGAISGGTFTNKPDNDYLADGFEFVQNGSEFSVVRKAAGGGSSGISISYNGGNSFSTSKSDVPTSVEIDGVPVPFTGNGSNFTVGCIEPNAKWITVKWNSTSITTNFTPDGLAECTTVAIPKTGDSSNALLYGALMFVLLAGVVGTAVTGKRKEHN